MLVSLTALSKLELIACGKFTNEGLSCLVSLASLRNLDLSCCYGIRGAGFQCLASLTMLTKLSLSRSNEMADNCSSFLTCSTSLRDLNLGSSDLTDVGVQWLTSLPTLAKLDLHRCHKLQIMACSLGQLDIFEGSRFGLL